MVGLLLKSRTKLSNRGVRHLLPDVDNTQVLICVGKDRLDLHCVFEMLDRLIEPALFAVECSKIAIGLGSKRSIRQFGKLLFCRSAIARASVRGAKSKLERNKVRPQIHRLFMALHRKFEITLLGECFTLVEMCCKRIGRYL